MRLHELIDQGERIGRRMAAADDGWVDVEWLITSGKMRKSDLTRSDWQGGFESSKAIPQPAIKFPCCPNCLSNCLAVERRPDGDATCGSCKWKGPYRGCFIAPECITATQVKERMADWSNRDRTGEPPSFTDDYQKYVLDLMDLFIDNIKASLEGMRKRDETK